MLHRLGIHLMRTLFLTLTQYHIITTYHQLTEFFIQHRAFQEYFHQLPNVGGSEAVLFSLQQNDRNIEVFTKRIYKHNQIAKPSNQLR